MTDDERSAHRVHKVAFDVAIEAPPVPGRRHDPAAPGLGARVAPRARQPDVRRGDVNPVLQFGTTDLDLGGAETVLVNRFYLRGIKQVDRVTGEPHQRLPGQGLGGTNWTERS